MAVSPPSQNESTGSLSFPAAHYAKLAPKSFLHACLTSSSTPIRPNGRSITECRDPSINTGSLTHADGSAVVRLGDTAVVCGIRAELLLASDVHGGLPEDLENWDERRADAGDGRPSRSDADIIAELNLLVPNLELSTGCNPSHLPGNPPSTLAQSLSQRILSLLRISNLVELEDLLVWHTRGSTGEDGVSHLTNDPNDPEDLAAEDEVVLDTGSRKREIKAIWTLYIDTLFISLDGSAFAAAWLAVLAALKDVVLPKAQWDEDSEGLTCSPLRQDATQLGLRKLPVPLSAVLFEHDEAGTRSEGEAQQRSWLLDDPDDFEEGVSEAQISVTVGNEGKQLIRIEAGGSEGLPLDEIYGLAARAGTRWKKWNRALNWNTQGAMNNHNQNA